MRPLVLAVVTAVLLVGCGSAGDGGASSGMAESADVAPSADGGDGAGFEVEEASLEDQAMIVEGSVGVRVDDPRGAAQAAVLLVERVGGRVAERSEEAGSEHHEPSAMLVMRVPAAEVNAFIERLGELGTVTTVNLSSTDVTMQTRDLDARIRAMELSISRLEEFMERATSTEDLLQAERTLTDRQAELEAMQSQRTRLADRVELSTLTVHFSTEGATPVEPAGGFTGGLQTGWESLVTAVGTTLLVLGVLLPWAALAGVVGLIVMAVRGRLRRREPLASATPATVPVGAGAAPVDPPADDAPRGA